MNHDADSTYFNTRCRMPNTVVHISRHFTHIELNSQRIKKLVKTVCEGFGNRKQPNTRYEVEIALVDDDEICRLNTRFLHRRIATDCLSFDLTEHNSGREQPKQRGSKPTRTFEIVVNAERAMEQAELRRHCPQSELALYITHGLLHQFGFDDSEKVKAAKMHDTEDRILHQLGFGTVYKNNVKRCRKKTLKPRTGKSNAR